MNIQQAKKEIIHTLQAYHLKDDRGKYRIPLERQRPILLMGPPGIGKTAILKQVAEETGVGLVSYSLTHHTRQSAVGLPHIEEKTLAGVHLTVTEYTMSEILASLYEYMDRTGKREGILFLDEVNCVSETLAPTMLQLLQNKTFGTHRVPEGWILVTAGNPPQYNRAVREFDVATLDRVRTIWIQPDVKAWMDYAALQQVHSSILSYLTIHPEHFYQAEDNGEKQEFVTARGWEDLSDLLKSYELLEIPVTREQISQYIQQPEAEKEFSTYYALYEKYREDYQIPEILGNRLSEMETEKRIRMASAAGFEERFTVVRLLCDSLQNGFRDLQKEGEKLEALRSGLLRLKRDWGTGPEDLAGKMEKSLKVRMEAGILREEEAASEQWVIARLQNLDTELKKNHVSDPEKGFAEMKKWFSVMTDMYTDQVRQQSLYLKNAFSFGERSFGEGQEMNLLVTELSQSRAAMDFIAENGSEEFLHWGQCFLWKANEKKLMEQCRKLME